jgi:putative phage-type endonuclease
MFYDFAPMPEPEQPSVKAQPGRDLKQNSEEWFAYKLGKISGSRIAEMMAKGTDELTRKKYMAGLAAERMTGIPSRRKFKSKAMQHGNEFETEAREEYEFRNGVDVELVGFIDHPTIPWAGCSPDGLVGELGMAQIKCPNRETYILYVEDKKIPREYQLQMQWEIACCERDWNDFVIYEPDLPAKMRFFAIREHRNDDLIKKIEQSAIRLNEDINRLIERMGKL